MRNLVGKRDGKKYTDLKALFSAYLLFELSVAFVDGRLEPLGSLFLGVRGLYEGFLVLRHLDRLSSDGRLQVLYLHLLLCQRSLQRLKPTPVKTFHSGTH